MIDDRTDDFEREPPAPGADKLNILLVDDQPAKLLSYQAILEGIGENLLTAGSAREALDLLLRTEVAVVLVDVCMPELDGFELVSLIRQHPRFQRTAVIFVSAVHLSELDRLKGYECGAVDYMPVPVQPEILRAKVAVFVELYRKTRQLEALNRELETRVAERTAELESAAARLVLSEERLRAADRRKDEFLAMLAHELRNPLAPIRTAVRLQRERSLPQAEREQTFEMMERQLEQLVRLIDDLMDVSRITRGQITLHSESIDLREAVRRAVEMLERQAEERRQELEVDLPEEPLMLWGDLHRLSQVVGNLLDNAVKYSPEGGQISLRARLDGDEAVISVRDSGPGIPRDKLEKVFELFEQLEGPDSKPSRGLGIGLALVRRIVGLHGGEVVARSRGQGRGTEMVVRLPLELGATPLGRELPRSLSSAPAGEPLRVVVADDNRDAANSLAMLLRLAGHEVHVAYDGTEVLELEDFEPEIVLLDLAMPGLDGYETARRLKQLWWGRRAALVAVSGWGQRQDRERTAEIGFSGHLVKPVAEADLFALLERLTGEGPVRSDPPLPIH